MRSLLRWRNGTLAAVFVCLAWPAGVAAEPVDGENVSPLNFTTDVLPVLSKHGCNSGGCHGKAIGQNGFLLSLYGFDPAADYNALVHESRGRRVAPAAPDDSLLLRKASGGLAHGGGVRFTTDSPAYRLLRRWIEQGTPWGSESDPQEVALEISPAQQVLSAAAKAGTALEPLQVVVRYSDGSTRDVTAWARYDSQHPEIITVSSAGVIEALGRAGEGDVMVRYQNFAASARVTIPLGDELPASAYAKFEPKTFIDDLVLAKWKTLHIAPSPEADDELFLRRAFLDALGTLPTPAEVREFADDPSPDKRDALIDRLVDRPEYADLWAHRWSDILRNRVGDSNFKEHTISFSNWIRQSLADNKPYDQFVREILTASGKRSEHPQIDWWRQAINHPVRVEDAAQAFLGLRVSCANCHNHPFENISQDDYWRFAAFFAKVDSPTYGAVNEIKFKEKGTVKHPRTDEVLTPKAFHGPSYDFVEGEDPRQKLVDWMAAPDNPFFARALVNRVWGHYLGVGLVDPVDDIRATNPPSNPELLDALARDFIEHEYDVKHLMKTIMKSRVYGLSSDPTDENRTDARNYARYYPRRLAPHVLLDAIAAATGTTLKFDGYDDVQKAVQLPNEKARSEFLDMFGRSSRDTPCECETSIAPNIGQVMYLLHSEELQRRIADSEGAAAHLAKSDKTSSEIVEELFLRTFSRRPSPAELQDAADLIESAEDKQATVEDLLWVLLNSKEFLFQR
jgi:hypothetical protein